MPAAKAKRKPVRQLDLLVLADVTSEGFVLFLSSRNTTVFRQVPFVSYFVVVIAAAIFCYLNRFSRPPPPITTTATHTETQHPLHLLHPNAFIRSHLPVLRRASTRRISTFDFYLLLHRAEDARRDQRR